MSIASAKAPQQQQQPPRRAPKRAPAPDPRAALRHSLEHAAHYLPAQAPLEVFVHHNTLHAYQHLPFHQAIAQAQARLGVRGYMSKETYRELMARGRIRESDLEAVLADEGLSDRPIAPGFPSQAAAVRLVIRHGVGAETPAHLRWSLVERDAANRFDADILAPPKAEIVRQTRSWLEKEIVAAGGPAGARATSRRRSSARRRASAAPTRSRSWGRCSAARSTRAT